MRNLKRALSLTLASVMLLGMMVVGSSAAGYPDVSEEENIEAIEVLQAVGVMGGDENGNFNPDDYVTREQMAVIMAQLLKLDYNYYKGTNPFSDVPEWAAPYVAACAANGVTAGIGGGLYGSKQNIQAVQAALMMLKALGYFQYPGDYEGGYILATVKQGTEVGLFDGIDSNADSPLTRNQVAQMALNALKAEMVSFTGDPGITYTGSNGESWVGGYKAEYTPRTSTEAKYNAIEGRTSDVATEANHKGQYYIQLGEQLYNGDLKLNNSAIDDFGRPARKWEYDGKAIGTYVKKELLKQAWTVEVTGKDFFDLLGADTIKKYDIEITIDGVDIDGKTGTTDHNTELKKTGNGKADSYFDETYMTKTYKSGVGQTGKGVLTQVYVDPDEGQNGTVWVAVINTYLAKATADYSEKKDEAAFAVYALTSANSGNNEVFYKYVDACDHDKAPGAQTKNLKVSADDFAVAADVKKDDIVLVTVANGEIKTITEPQVLSASTLNGFSRNSYVVAEGTQYDYNTTVDYDPDTLDDYTGISSTQHLKDTEYNLYLDAYGYLIGVEVVDAVKNYIFLTGIDNASSNLKNKTAEAAGILLDGSFVEFTMNLSDSEAYWTHGGYAADAGDTARTGVSYAGGAADTTGKFTEGPLWNTWCTYTVDKNGVYTLKEVKGLANVTGSEKAKAGQYHDANYSDKDIDSKHISLKSADGSNYVYGNDKSVYIVAELDSITSHAKIDKKHTVKMPDADAAMKATVTSNETKVGIISDVDSVTTGIDNVSLNTWTAAEIEKELKDTTNTNKAYPGNVYTLFDNDGYVIAAVVVGEDDGTSKNLVYSHKDKIESEFYSKADDEWTWTRKVIHNGKEITLTEKGSDISVLKSLKENVWFEITYKADGTVKDAEYVQFTDAQKRVGVSTAYSPLGGPAMTLADEDDDEPGDFVNDIGDLEYAINDNKNDSTTVYEQVWGTGVDSDNNPVSNYLLAETNAPSLSEHTLYMNTNARKGFRVQDDVKTVFIQKNDGKKTVEYGENASDLKSFLDKLNYSTANSSYCFKISAILSGAHASVVVIHDWNETGATTSGTHGGGSKAIDWITTDAVNNFTNPTWWTEDGNNPTVDQIREMLESEGCTNIVYDAGSNEWSFTTKGGTRITGKTINLTGKKVKVTVGNNEAYYSAGAVAWATILGEAWSATKHGDYAKVTGNNTTTYAQMQGQLNYTVPAYDVKLEVGYYKVTVATPITNSVDGANGGGGSLVTATDPANFYTLKETSGSFTVPVKVTTTDPTKGTGLTFNVSGMSGAAITSGGSIGGGTTQAPAGTYTVNVSVPYSSLVSGTNELTLTVGATPAYIDVTLVTAGGTTTEHVLATTTMKSLLTDKSITTKDKVYFLVTEKGGDTRIVESTDDTTALKPGDTVDTTGRYVKLGATLSANKGTITGPTAAGLGVAIENVTGTFTDTAGSNNYLKIGTDLVFTAKVTNSAVASATEKADNGIKVTVASGSATQATVTVTSPANGKIADADALLDADNTISGQITCSVAEPAGLDTDTTLTITIEDAT